MHVYEYVCGEEIKKSECRRGCSCTRCFAVSHVGWAASYCPTSSTFMWNTGQDEALCPIGWHPEPFINSGDKFILCLLGKNHRSSHSLTTISHGADNTKYFSAVRVCVQGIAFLFCVQKRCLAARGWFDILTGNHGKNSLERGYTCDISVFQWTSRLQLSSSPSPA